MTWSDATREVYWNIPGHAWLYAILLPAAFVFAFGVARHLRMWSWGRSQRPILHAINPQALVAGRRAARTPLMIDSSTRRVHASLVFAFALLAVATLIVFVHHELGVEVMRGAFYLVFQSLLVDMAGLVGMVALGVALLRGGFGRKSTYTHRETPFLLAALLANLVSGFLIEGARIAVTGDPWAMWSPVGALVASALCWLPDPTIASFHRGLWWSHLVLSLSILAYLPYSSFAHMVLVPLNRMLHTTEPGPGPVAPHLLHRRGEVDAGVVRLSDFTWRDLLDVDACIGCGRCDAVCPVHATGGPLAPATVMRGLQSSARSRQMERPLVDAGAISREAIWACTTCGACVDACPSAAAPLPKLTDLRRGALESGSLPDALVRPLESLQRWGNPFGEPPERRSDWILSLPRAAQVTSEPGARILYWIGCAGAYNPTAQRTTAAVAKLMQQAGLPYVTLGNAERCCGEPARRLGEEGLFRELAVENVKAIKSASASRIVTHCAHCLHVLRREYAAFGLDVAVIHHTELLDELAEANRLQPAFSGRVTYHDPCYLGRHCGVFDAPRNALGGGGVELREMAHTRENARCCGAGGGQLWNAVPGSDRMNLRRFREAAETKPDTVVTACPYCKIMMEDAAATSREQTGVIHVKDIAELFVDS